MTFEEIWQAGKDGKIDRFKAYELLEERTEELAYLDMHALKTWKAREMGEYKSSEIYKQHEIERDDCVTLQQNIIDDTFDEFAGKDYATDKIYNVTRAIFDFEKAMHDDTLTDKEKKMQKEITENVINSAIDFLKGRLIYNLHYDD